MAYFKGGVTNNLKSNSVNKRPMTIIKKEDMDKEFEEKIIDYCTFYRRNVHRFVEHYFWNKITFISNYYDIFNEFMSASRFVVCKIYI